MTSDSTRWTVIRRAAAGSPADREEFVRLYAPIVQAYLGARWRTAPMLDHLEDASQQVFVECFEEGGALTRADPERGPGFRAFLYGITRNVARKMERGRARARERQPGSDFDLEALPADEDSCARVFDRAWATALLREAVDRHLAEAGTKGPEAVRRHQLLILRHGEDRPLRDIAAEWHVERETIYREYRKAREEFRRALVEVVRELNGGGRESVDRECERLARLFD